MITYCTVTKTAGGAGGRQSERRVVGLQYSTVPSNDGDTSTSPNYGILSRAYGCRSGAVSWTRALGTGAGVAASGGETGNACSAPRKPYRLQLYVRLYAATANAALASATLIESPICRAIMRYAMRVQTALSPVDSCVDSRLRRAPLRLVPSAQTVLS